MYAEVKMKSKHVLHWESTQQEAAIQSQLQYLRLPASLVGQAAMKGHGVLTTAKEQLFDYMNLHNKTCVCRPPVGPQGRKQTNTHTHRLPQHPPTEWIHKRYNREQEGRGVWQSLTWMTEEKKNKGEK